MFAYSINQATLNTFRRSAIPVTDSLKAALPSVVLSAVATLDDGLAAVEPGTNAKLFDFAVNKSLRGSYRLQSNNNIAICTVYQP